MNHRPLLDYLAYHDDFAEPVRASAAEPERASAAERVREAARASVAHSTPSLEIDPLAARLKDLEARLRPSEPARTHSQDLTLSTQIEAILRRKAALEPTSGRQPVSGADAPARIALDPPPTVPVANDTGSVDADFLRFSEAVYLIGQAAKRFIEEPQARQAPLPVAQIPSVPVASTQVPSTQEIDALSAVLRETVSAFRSVADDLAVSAGEIRHYATREERQPTREERQPSRRRPQAQSQSRYRDDDEIIELRDSIADLQDRLDDLLNARRRRY